jgi:hypothetical protein
MDGRIGFRAALLAAALMAALPNAGWARSGGWLQRLDANGDGAVDRDEARRARAPVFERLDADRDGALSADELAAAGRKPRVGATATKSRPGSRLLARGDRDKDGRLSRDEFMAFADATLARRDRNGDGRVTADEIPPPRQRRPVQP